MHAVDELVHTSTAAEQELAKQVMADLLGPFVREIAEADLDEADSAGIETAVNQLHILCTLCAAVLEGIAAMHEAAEQLADEIADQIIAEAAQGPALSSVAQAVLRRALRQSFGALADVVADPVRVQMLQLVGYATCPDVSDHPEVRKYCVDPLAEGLVTTTMQEWIGGGFPVEAVVLQRARPRTNGRPRAE